VRDRALLIARVQQRAGRGEKGQGIRIDQVTPDDVERLEAETDSDALQQPLQCEIDLRSAEAPIETGYTANSIRIFASSAGLERNGE
jgi:hypothetical protein